MLLKGRLTCTSVILCILSMIQADDDSDLLLLTGAGAAGLCRVFFFNVLEDVRHFGGATDTPVFGF